MNEPVTIVIIGAIVQILAIIATIVIALINKKISSDTKTEVLETKKELLAVHKTINSSLSRQIEGAEAVGNLQGRKEQTEEKKEEEK